MKTRLLLLALFSTFQFTASAQWTDTWQNSTNYLQGGCFATGADTCFVTGNNGKIYRTLNGGTTWDSAQTIFTQSWFSDIEFPSPTVGYACGGTSFGMHHSTIAKTTNGGAIWDSLTANTFSFEFYSLSAPDENTAYFAGFELVKTTDGGQTFTIIPYSTDFAQISAIEFITADLGFIALRGSDFAPFGPVIKILKTENGGASWATVFADSSAQGEIAKGITAMTFRDQLNGFAVGDNGRVLRTTDGGQSWSLSTIAAENFYLTDIAFADNSPIGFISAYHFTGGTADGYIYKTTDGGTTWQLDFHGTEAIASVSANGNTAYASSSKSVYKLSDITSVAEKADARQPFSVYPNPAKNLVTINFTEFGAEEFTIQLIDIKCRLVKQIMVPAGGKNTIQISVNDVPSGLYSVKVVSGRNVWLEKLIIE